MKLRISKHGLIVAFFSLLIFFNDSTGFDFYAHSVSYYFFDESLNNVDVLMGLIVLPRYWLLSYLYETFSRVGVPAGFLASFLIAFPVYFTSKKIISSRKNKGRNSLLISDYLIVTGLYLLAFYYSGLSLVLLWFIAYLITGNKVFLLGGFFHPVGFLLYSAGIVFFIRKDVFVFYILFSFLLMFFYVCTVFSLYTSSLEKSVRFYIDVDNTLKLLDAVFHRKKQEIFGLLVICVAFYMGKDGLLRRLNFLKSFSAPVKLIYLYSFLIVCVLYFSMLNRTTLLNSVMRLSFDDVIYVSWFDWGGKDISDSYSTLYSKRY